MSIIKAPFTDEQVKNLNDYQESGIMHEFTCGNQNHPMGQARCLVATKDGWVCPGCNYTQDWAHDWMADPSIRASVLKIIG